MTKIHSREEGREEGGGTEKRNPNLACSKGLLFKIFVEGKTRTTSYTKGGEERILSLPENNRAIFFRLLTSDTLRSCMGFSPKQNYLGNFHVDEKEKV